MSEVKPMTQSEVEQEILSILKNLGRVVDSDVIHSALIDKGVDLDTFRKAFEKLSREKKIQLYIGLP